MLLEAALIQIILRAAVENALEVAASLRFLMNLQVLFQITAAREFLVTELTRERFLPGMYSLVADEVRHLGEGLLAARVLTAVRLRLVVHASMLLQ